MVMRVVARHRAELRACGVRVRACGVSKYHNDYTEQFLQLVAYCELTLSPFIDHEWLVVFNLISDAIAMHVHVFFEACRPKLRLWTSNVTQD